MASDIATEDGLEQSGIDDVDSLASTVESEQASEYAVEDILAERNVSVEPDSDDPDEEAGRVTQYLVKWLGYTIDRCSWEPKQQFDTEETLRNWEHKKQLIAEGKQEGFNVERWLNHCEILAKKTEQRKKERRRKRERRARQKFKPQSPQDQPEARSLRRPQRRLSTDSVASALFVPAETPPPRAKKAPSRQSPPPPPPESERPTMAAPQTSSKRPLRSSRLAQVAKEITTKHNKPASKPSVHPKSPENARPETARPAASGFGVGPGSKRGRTKTSRHERAPGFSETNHIMKPSEFAPRTMMKDNTLAMALATQNSQSGEPQSQITDETITSMASSPKLLFAPTGPSPIGQQAEFPVSSMAPPAPIVLASSAPSNVYNSASLPGSLGPISSPAVPTMPRAMAAAVSTAEILDSPTQIGSSIHPERSVLIQELENHDKADSCKSFTDTYGRSEISRPSPPSRQYSPPRRRSPSRWSSPPRGSSYRRESPLRRNSPSRWQSPSRRSSSPGRSPRRRPSPPWRGSRRSLNNQFSRGGDSWRPRSPSPIYSRRIDESGSLTSANVIERSPTVSQAIAPKEPTTATSVQRKVPGETPIAVTTVGGRHSLPSDHSRSIASGISAETRMARMPVNAKPKTNRFGLMSVGDYWWDNLRDEVLVHVYFGPEKHFIGPLKLCGIFRDVKKDLLLSAKSPRSSGLEMWFRHVCTAAEFERLYPPSPRNIISTGWAEGFKDTNRELFRMSEVLRKDDLIAICYPVNPKPSVKYAWVAWSRGSPNFEFPPKSNNELPSDVEIPLLVAAHTMLPPIDTLGPRTSQSLDSNTPAISTDIPLINRIGLPGSRNTQGYERQLRRPIVQNDPMISGSFQPQNLLTSSKERPAATESDSYSRTDLVFLKQPGTRVDPKVLFKGLNELMNVEKLATIEDSGEPIKADYFFLHFPLDEKEAQEELIILKGHLEFHGKMVSTNLAPDGWAKFMRNSKMGVVIFHELFMEFKAIKPPLSKVAFTPLFTYWVIRVKMPLRFIDDRYISPGDHCARIFPKRGVVLLTEDMLDDLKGTAITLQWFRTRAKEIAKSTRQSTPWHLMLPPKIIEWLETRLDDENYSEQHGLMVLVLSLIMECNVSDFRTERFEESSLDPDFATSLAMSPIMYEYGSRTELDEPKIKDKTERDAHHLIDFFSGWAFINRQRFRHFAVVTSIELPASEEWGTWGHIEVMRGGYAHFFECFKIHADKMWRTLDTSAQKPRSQQSTPVASTTPRTPNYNAHSSNTAQQSTFQQGKPSALGPSRYPAPYK